MTRPSEYFALPPGYGRRARVAAVAVGWTQLVGMVFVLVLGEAFSAMQRSLDDPNGLVTTIAGVPAPVLVGCLGIAVLRGGRAVAGDEARGYGLDLDRARRVHRWMARLLIAVVVVALLAGLAELVALFAQHAIDNVALDLIMLLWQVVAAIIGVIGYLGGRFVVRPSPVDLAKAARAAQFRVPWGSR